MRLVGEVSVLERQREEESFYTVASLAKRLTVTERTVKNMIRDGEIPVYRVRGAVRIDPVDVDSLLARNREVRSAA